MAAQGEILDQTRDILQRPIDGQVRFSDVFPETVGLDEASWWQRTDFDAKLTDEVESSGFPKAEQIPIGFRPWLANYGLILVDDLVRGRNQRLLAEDLHRSGYLHPDVVAELAESFGAVLALANYAPRDETNTANGANGSDFYLATTDSGLEVYTTPLSFLSGLDARHRITGLYRIPNEGHPEFDGQHEQFRSARVIRTRRHPDHLVPVFEYADREAVIAAKQTGNHPEVIPSDERDGHIAFIDKFGNVKLELGADSLRKISKLGRFASLVICEAGEEHEFEVQLAADLRSAPLGQLAVYANCSDHIDKDSASGFVELAARVDGNPSTSRETAIFKLLERIPKLDPASSEVRLVA